MIATRIGALAPAVQHGVAQAVGHSLQDVFLTAAPVALACFPVVLLLQERPLRRARPRPPKAHPLDDDEGDRDASPAR